MNKVPADTPVERAREALEEALRGLGDGKSEAIERVRFAHAILAGLDEYLAAHSTPATPEVLELCHRTTLIDWEELNARRVTQFAYGPTFSAGAFEGSFVGHFAELLQARTVLEIGTFTATTTLAVLQRVAPRGGEVHTIEIDPFLADLDRKNLHELVPELEDRVHVHCGAGQDVLARLAEQGVQFDLIFIDADKLGYLGYYKTIMARKLLAPRGCLLVDNTLFKAKPFTTPPAEYDVNTRALDEFNKYVVADAAVRCTLLPLRDGVSMISFK